MICVFIIGYIAGGISGMILMAACAVAGRNEECRECSTTYLGPMPPKKE